MNLVKAWAKTIAAFVAVTMGNMIVSLVNDSAPWPQTQAEWIRYVLTGFGAAIAVALTRNKITQKQLDKDPNVIGGVVVPEAVATAAPSAPVIPPSVAGWKPPY